RIREVRHRLGEGTHRRASAAYATVRRVPLPTGVRRWGYRTLPWRLGTVEVRIDKILLGGQNRLDARAFSSGIDDAMWASTRLIDGPHVRLLEDFGGASPSDEAILASDYGAM